MHTNWSAITNCKGSSLTSISAPDTQLLYCGACVFITSCSKCRYFLHRPGLMIASQWCLAHCMVRMEEPLLPDLVYKMLVFVPLWLSLGTRLRHSCSVVSWGQLVLADLLVPSITHEGRCAWAKPHSTESIFIKVIPYYEHIYATWIKNLYSSVNSYDYCTKPFSYRFVCHFFSYFLASRAAILANSEARSATSAVLSSIFDNFSFRRCSACMKKTKTIVIHQYPTSGHRYLNISFHLSWHTLTPSLSVRYPVSFSTIVTFSPFASS